MSHPTEPHYSAQLAALRSAGAADFDPVRLHYMEALARRTLAHQGKVQQLLEHKLAHALAAFKLGFEPAHALVQASAPPAPEPLVATRSSLRDLVRAMGPQLPPTSGTLPPELKSVRQFRNTWSKLSVDKQLSNALHHAPKNAGPINSHMLVLRSLALMRDISPDYLNRFMSYADTLLCLDHCHQALHVPVKKPPIVKKPTPATQPVPAKKRSRRT